MSAKPQMVKKVTVKTCTGGLSRKEIPEIGEVRPMMRILGVIAGFKEVKTEYGLAIGFKGMFKAECLSGQFQGRKIQGMTCFLPDIAAYPLKAAFEAGGNQQTEFALNIDVQGAENPVGYEYVVSAPEGAENLNTGADPLAALEEKMTGRPTLTGPRKEAPEQPGGMGHGATEKQSPAKPAAKKRGR